MQTRYLYLLRFILALCDLALINICFFIASYLSKSITEADKGIFVHNIFTSTVVWLLTTSIFSLYSEKIIKIEYIYKATSKSVCLHAFVFIAYLSMSGHTGFQLHFITVFYAFMVTGFLISCFLGTALQSILKHNFDIRKSVAVLGMNNGGHRLAAYLQKQENLNFLGFLGEESLHVDPDGELIHSAKQQLINAAGSNIDEVFVSLTPERMGHVGNLVREAEKHCVRLKFVPDFSHDLIKFKIDHIDGFPVLSVRKEPGKWNKHLKKNFSKMLFNSLIIFHLYMPFSKNTQCRANGQYEKIRFI